MKKKLDWIPFFGLRFHCNGTHTSTRRWLNRNSHTKWAVKFLGLRRTMALIQYRHTAARYITVLCLWISLLLHTSVDRTCHSMFVYLLNFRCVWNGLIYSNSLAMKRWYSWQIIQENKSLLSPTISAHHLFSSWFTATHGEMKKLRNEKWIQSKKNVCCETNNESIVIVHALNRHSSSFVISSSLRSAHAIRRRAFLFTVYI